MKRTLTIALTSALAMMFVAAPAMAADPPAAGGDMAIGLSKLGAALAIGLAAGFCGIGQGLAAAAACEGTARNPSAGKQIFMVAIIGLSLIESLTIFALLIAFTLAA